MVAPKFVIAGTDTGVGKTVFAAALADALDADYWKPVQAGLEEATDLQMVGKLTGLGPDRLLPEVYRLSQPMSPHLAAKIDAVEIDVNRLVPPVTDRPLVIELAGGLLVPLTDEHLQIDVVSNWGASVVLVARTSLGTINHSLLSLEALRARDIPVQGIAFVGEANADVEERICEIGKVSRLGRLPLLPQLSKLVLAEAFLQNFDVEDFL